MTADQLLLCVGTVGSNLLSVWFALLTNKPDDTNSNSNCNSQRSPMPGRLVTTFANLGGEQVVRLVQYVPPHVIVQHPEEVGRG